MTMVVRQIIYVRDVVELVNVIDRIVRLAWQFNESNICRFFESYQKEM